MVSKMLMANVEMELLKVSFPAEIQ